LRFAYDPEEVLPAGSCCRRPEGSSARLAGIGVTPVAVVTAAVGEVAWSVVEAVGAVLAVVHSSCTDVGGLTSEVTVTSRTKGHAVGA